jgi:hypothetical protein
MPRRYDVSAEEAEQLQQTQQRLRQLPTSPDPASGVVMKNTPRARANANAGESDPGGVLIAKAPEETFGLAKAPGED